MWKLRLKNAVGVRKTAKKTKSIERAESRAKVAIEDVKEVRTLAELVGTYGLC